MARPRRMPRTPEPLSSSSRSSLRLWRPRRSSHTWVRVQGLGSGVLGLGFGVQGLGFRVQGLGFRIQGLGFGIEGLGHLVWGLGFGVWGLGFKFVVSGIGFRVSGFGSRGSVSGFGLRIEGSGFRLWAGGCNLLDGVVRLTPMVWGAIRLGSGADALPVLRVAGPHRHPSHSPLRPESCSLILRSSILSFGR